MEIGLTDSFTDVLAELGISMTGVALSSVFVAKLVTAFFKPVFVINFLFGFDFTFDFEAFTFTAPIDLTAVFFLIFDFTAMTHILSWIIEAPSASFLTINLLHINQLNSKLIAYPVSPVGIFRARLQMEYAA